MNLDDCWQASVRDANGRVQVDSERFPSGLKALSDYIHSKGLKFGIYSSAGFKTCQGFPASLGVEEVDAASYSEWGVDYLKYDNCFQDYGLPQVRFPPMASALQASGRDVFYSLCEWGRENPAVWASSIGAHSWRISPDIRDAWTSIRTRSEIGASLWRYSGPTKGWNDPDMLEIGNGGCNQDEYQTHFSLWAMLKAPLIVGNDIRVLEESVMGILGNKEVIAINQDELGRQARVTWSDLEYFGGRVIATKCTNGESYEDAPSMQQWVFADGLIKNTATNTCLAEHSKSSSLSPQLNFTFPIQGVSAVPCEQATKWTVGEGNGGAIVSQASGNCLEVEKFEFLPITQGKRIQTAPCQTVIKGAVDIREHQAWTTPAHTMRNLYQRQCLTVDKDALPGTTDVWTAPLVDGFAVLLVNKGHITTKMELTLAKMQVPSGKTYRARDLWEHRNLLEVLSDKNSLSFMVPSHGSVMLKLTEV